MTGFCPDHPVVSGVIEEIAGSECGETPGSIENQSVRLYSEQTIEISKELLLMKTFEFESRFARRAAAVLALGLTMAAQTAIACTSDNWFAVSDPGDVLASGPDGPDGKPAIARYSGVCAMQTAANTTTWVEDDSPGGIDRIRARFYVLVDNTDNAEVYRGLNGGGNAIFTVNINPGNGNVRLVSSGQSVTCAGCANTGDWNSVEIDWDAGGGDMALVVNGGAPVSTAFSSAETISAVRLGNLNNATGTMNFDAYESRRTTEIGRLCRANPDGDGTRDINDLQELFGEIQSLGGSPAPGTPDANEDGAVDLPDLGVTFQFIQSLQGDCTAFPG